jgi:hypothetical protein
MPSVKEMHYQFKLKLEKVDSATNVNYIVPEIDWRLKRAEAKFIKERVSQSNPFSKGTYEFNNKVIDDLKNIIIPVTITSLTHAGTSTNWYANLPTDYYYYIDCKATCTKGNITKVIPCQVRNNTEEIMIFNSSSFEWEELNVIFLNKQLVFITDGTFNITSITLKYVKVPVLFHNAESHYGTVSVLGSVITTYYTTYSRVPRGLVIPIGSIVAGTLYTINGYKALNGLTLFGYVDSELSENTFEDIVNIAIQDVMENLITSKQQQN